MSTENRFTVRPESGLIIAEEPPSGEPLILTREEAINLAAWLAAVADPEHALEVNGPFQTTLRSIVT